MNISEFVDPQLIRFEGKFKRQCAKRDGLAAAY